MANFRKSTERDSEPVEFEERVVSIKRCSKVVKGGRNFSFSALVVVGNHNGKVGVGIGKANEVADAIRKGTELARKAVVRVRRRDGHTIPHEVEARFRGGHILLRPAAAGTGVIAGGGMRAVLDLSGIKDVLGKSLGSNNPINTVRATMKAIHSLRTREEIMRKRGLWTNRPVEQPATETEEDVTVADDAAVEVASE